MSAEKFNNVAQMLDQMQMLVGQTEQDLEWYRQQVIDLRQEYQLLRQQGIELQQQLSQYSELERHAEPLVKDQEEGVPLANEKVAMDDQE
ncbi:MAG: hypothetical protein QGG88_11035 [Gammaproteobacteria bacterium]|jgi:F0F1-type ATP synthase membrane subunit b/b'|nr:hypothetical protein [Gammaproteobacteria bacterium]